jgi:hypothetical protein
MPKGPAVLSSDPALGGPLMRSVTYSMGASLDGYIVGPDGTFDWDGACTRRCCAGRPPTRNPSLDEAELEWAAFW